MSEFTVKTTFTLNGVKVEQDIAARQHLVDFLRDCHDLTGSHLGCEHGVCGACQVMVDGQVVRGCLTLAVQMQGRSVDTIRPVRAGRPGPFATSLFAAQRLPVWFLLIGHVDHSTRHRASSSSSQPR